MKYIVELEIISLIGGIVLNLKWISSNKSLKESVGIRIDSLKVIDSNYNIEWK